MKYTKILILALLLPTAIFAQGSQITQDISVKLNSVGYADISFSAKLNAREWQGWMSMYGNAQHVLKRDLKHDYSTIHMENFAMNRNDADREYTVEFSAHGASTYLGDNRWEFDIESDARVTELADGRYQLTHSESQQGGGVFNQIWNIELPADATSAEVGTGELGQDVIRYELPTEPSGGAGLLWPGAGTAGVGLAMLLIGFTRKSKSDPVTINVEPQPQIQPPAEGEAVVVEQAAEKVVERTE